MSSPVMNRSRVERVLSDAGVDVVVATTYENVFYFSGYEGFVQRVTPATQVYAILAADRIGAAKEKLARYAQEAGRDPSTIKIAPQLIVCVGENAEEARRRFEGSQLYEHLVSLQQSTLKNVAIDEYMATNLVGTPEQVC